MDVSQNITKSNWSMMIFLFSWNQIRETIPAMIWICILSFMNAVQSKEYDLYIRRFIFYIILCYFCYSIHLFSANLEEKVFGSMTHFYEPIALLIILFEFSNFYSYGEQKLKVILPLINSIMQRINGFVSNLLPSIAHNRRKTDKK